LGILAIIGVFTLVALTHGQQDHALGKMLGVGGVVISGSVVAALAGVPLEQTDQLQGTPWGYLMLSMGSTIAMLSINLINLIILFVAVWKSGNTERRTVLTQLTNQPQSVVTPAELAGVKAERRLHLRTVPGYPQKTARKIRSLQNELAFRQDFLQRRGDALENDPPSAVLKQLIEAERANPIS
jgi:hypothetical protein